MVTLSMLGVALYLICDIEILPAIMISFGFSVSGFLIKNTAAQNPKGAGINKIALSLGNMFSGAVIFLLSNNHNEGFFIILILLLISMLIIIKNPDQSNKLHRKTKSFKISEIIKDPKSYLIWLFFGVVIGIRLFGFYAILPHYLQNNLGFLPSWYGTVFSIYGVIVIISQFHAISNKFHIKLEVAVFFLIAAIFIMVNPAVFYIETFYGAVIWVSILAIEELFAPYLDFAATKKSGLMIKEIGVGIGGAMSPMIIRSTDDFKILLIVSLILSFLGYIMYRKDRYAQKKTF